MATGVDRIWAIRVIPRTDENRWPEAIINKLATGSLVNRKEKADQ